MKDYDDWKLASPPEPDWEGDMEVECGNETERELTNILGFSEDVISMCMFSGEVSVVVEGSLGYWTCPDCGYEHEMKMDKYAGMTREDYDEMQADAAYDRMREERE